MPTTIKGGDVQGRQASKLNTQHPSVKRLLSLAEALNVGDLAADAVDASLKEAGDIWQEVVDSNVTQERLPTRQSIGRDQVNFPPELVETLFPNEPAAYGLPDELGRLAPPIDADIEDQIAEDFARLKGVTTLDIERDPSLRDEYARYLGQRTRTMDPDRYNMYDDLGTGYDATGAAIPQGAVPTMYRTPTRLAELNRLKYPDETSSPKLPLSEVSRGDEARIKKNLMDYGATQETADRIWEEAKNFDPETNVIADNLSVLANRATTLAEQDDYPAFIDGIKNMANKVHFAVQNTFLGNTPRMSPAAIERFVDKIIEMNPDASRINAKEFLYTFMASYGSVAEMNPNAGRAYSDFMLLAVLDHARTKAVRYEDEKTSDEATLEQRTETTAEAIARNEQKLMVNVSDDRKIGETILKNMGWDNATSEQQAIAGAIAKAIVGDVFSQQEGTKTDSDFTLADEKLFHKDTTGKLNSDGSFMLIPGTNAKQLYTGLALTAKGLEIAERLQPLFNAVMPKSKRNVRRRRSSDNVAYIKKLKNKETAEGAKVDIGSTDEMEQMLAVNRNTPVTINPNMAAFLLEIAEEMKKFNMNFRNQLDTSEALLAYQQSLMSMLDGPEFQNMKGDGTGEKGIYGFRPGKVYSRNRQGEFELDEDGNRIELKDYSDGIKDSSFNDTINFILENTEVMQDGTLAGKEFFYDFFFGLNSRLSVSQTVGNYQSSKLNRSVIASAEPFSYHLDNPMHVVSLKAGIMKRFGYDKMDLLTAADMFDSQINEWSQADTKRKIEIAASKEGWASVASMQEGIAFNKKLQNPHSVEYTTGFYTEIDGLTNGMAHSAVQAGDLATAWAANIFDPKTYKHWAQNYDELERLVREGDFDNPEMLSPERRAELAIYLDAYNQVNDRMKNMMRRLWGKGPLKPVDIHDVGLPGLITESASFAAQAIMDRAHGASGDGKGMGSQKFKDALSILNKHKSPLGRKFIKKPVMIFGYGAGATRIGEAVRAFVDELFMTEEGMKIRDEMVKNGIDIDKHFIDPLGVIASEAVNQQFHDIKNFATTLSRAATEAANQEFALKIPTQAGYFINLGGLEYKVDDARGRKVKFEYFPGKFRAAENRRDGKGGRKGMSSTISGLMKATWHPFFSPQGFLKAATQITVMLNHANDNINMQRHLVNVHKAKLREKNVTSYGAWLAQLENENNPKAKRNGNLSLHIFDGLLTMPIEAERHATELNKVFKKMLKAEKGHTSYVEDALTFELNLRGKRKRIPVSRLKNLGKKKWDSYSMVERANMVYERLLSEEGKRIAADENWSSWHPSLNRYAFDWTTEEAAQIKQDLRFFDTERKRKAEAISHVLQFFWGTRPLNQQITSADEARIKNHTKSRRKIT